MGCSILLLQANVGHFSKNGRTEALETPACLATLPSVLVGLLLTCLSKLIRRTHFKVAASCELQEKFPTPPSGTAETTNYLCETRQDGTIRQ